MNRRLPARRLGDIRRLRFATQALPAWTWTIRLRSDHWRPRPVHIMRAKEALRGHTIECRDADGNVIPTPPGEIDALCHAMAHVARLRALHAPARGRR